MESQDDYPIASQSIVLNRRNWIVLLLLIALVLVAVNLYLRPAHTYDAALYSRTWLSDVSLAENKTNNGNFAPTGALRDVPGIGTVKDVVVDKGNYRKAVMVEFLTGVDQQYTGLVYVKGYPPPPDSCNVHLGGPWWQVVPLNITEMKCPRGYSFTGGG